MKKAIFLLLLPALLLACKFDGIEPRGATNADGEIVEIGTPVFAWRSAQWKKGRDWFDRSENLWNGLTRCHRWETTSFTTTYNPCMQFTTGTTPWINCLNATCPGNWAGCFYPTTYNSTVFVRLPSDGLVCEDSQIMDGIPQSNIYTADGANHREENNTTNRPAAQGGDVMRIIFDRIWNRDLGDFFQTNTRQQGC